MKVDPVALAWAAGILEGEGCFSIFKRVRASGNEVVTCSILCEMTDEDVILKLKDILGVGNISHRLNDKRSDNMVRKQSWILSIQKQKDVFDTLVYVMPHLGKRRLAKATEIFNQLEGKLV